MQGQLRTPLSPLFTSIPTFRSIRARLHLLHCSEALWQVDRRRRRPLWRRNSPAFSFFLLDPVVCGGFSPRSSCFRASRFSFPFWVLPLFFSSSRFSSSFLPFLGFLVWSESFGWRTVRPKLRLPIVGNTEVLVRLRFEIFDTEVVRSAVGRGKNTSVGNRIQP